MAYNSKAKIKILYLLKILQEETDAEHGLTMTQIIERLGEYGVSAERKSIYNDIKTLREFDIDIKTYQRSPVEYAIERRDFSLGELMLMVDAIQSCRAITNAQARMLITNIKTLANNYEQEKLNRRIHVVGRVKSKNDSVFATVDAIHEALRLRCKIEFSYKKFGADGAFHETCEGKKHLVSPVGVSYDEGFYYMTAWDERHENMAEYRLDRMTRVLLCKNDPATHNAEITNYRYDDNKALMFGRFSGKEVLVTLSVAFDKVEIITDRFGDAATFLKTDESRAYLCVKVCVSDQFFGWIAGMGKTVQIVEPDSLVQEYRDYLQYLLSDLQMSDNKDAL